MSSKTRRTAKKDKNVELPAPHPPISNGSAALLSFAAAIFYYVSNPKPQNYYDYTFRVAANLLGGRIAFSEPQPSWLNEFVPFEGSYYSVFPLGAVLTMIPAAFLKFIGLITDMPGLVVASLLGGSIVFLLLKIANRYDVADDRRLLLTGAIVFGTFMWTNLTFAGAWQLALGFAMVGELGAIYFTVYDRRPIIAGLFFALAFGNRTENLLTAPVFMYLLARDRSDQAEHESNNIEAEDQRSKIKDQTPDIKFQISDFKFQIPDLIKFCAIPFLLGVATLTYNYVRFHSFTDFGYARIPGVLKEPWYSEGIFSISYMPRQAWEMLWRWWNWKASFPYLVPDGFSSSILWSSPFLLFVLRAGSRDRVLKYASWVAIVILTFLLWIHGNSGGWQFGYRYAMILLPWAFVILLETAPKKISPLEWTIYGFSFFMNLYATWLFHWTEYLK